MPLVWGCRLIAGARFQNGQNLSDIGQQLVKLNVPEVRERSKSESEISFDIEGRGTVWLNWWSRGYKDPTAGKLAEQAGQSPDPCAFLCRHYPSYPRSDGVHHGRPDLCRQAAPEQTGVVFGDVACVSGLSFSSGEALFISTFKRQFPLFSRCVRL
jgi:hypothetical protein